MKPLERKDRPYPRSFAKRLTWRVMLVVLIVMGIIFYLIFSAGWASIMAGIHFLTGKYLEGKSEAIRRTLTEVRVASVNTVPRLEENIDKPERMYDIMENLVRQNPSIRSCGISFADGYYSQKGHWFCPYAVRRDSDVVVQTVGDKQHDYLHDEWFTKAMTAEEGYWSEPFYDGQDKKTALVSWLSPIRDKQGKTVAVFGVDLTLEKLEELLQSIFSKDYDSQGGSSYLKVTPISDDDDGQDSAAVGNWDGEYELYMFLINGNGTYLVHPDSQRVVKGNFFKYAEATPDTIDDHLGHIMVSGRSGYYEGIGDQDLILDRMDAFVEFTPIKDSNWSVAWAFPKIFFDVIGYLVGGIFAFFVLIGLLIVFFACRRSIKKATKSLKQLASSADEVAKGNFSTELPKLKSRDEIHQLRDSFEKMQHSLTSYIDELKTTTAQKASIESELKVAHDIQMSMLPKTFPPYPERDDIDIYGMLKPAKDVGGDLFDFYIRDEQLFFCIGDVSGKGVPASLVMAVTRSLFRNISAHVSEPHQIVRALNKSLTDGNETCMFVTLFLGVLDLKTGHLAFCNAGHNAPLLVEQVVGTIPCESNLPIGVMPDWEFVSQQIALKPGSMVFLFTDGLNEAENIKHDQFGDHRIVRVIAQLLTEGGNQPDIIVGKMGEAVHSFVGEAEQSDDLTMLAIQYKCSHTDEQQ